MVERIGSVNGGDNRRRRRRREHEEGEDCMEEKLKEVVDVVFILS